MLKLIIGIVAGFWIGSWWTKKKSSYSSTTNFSKCCGAEVIERKENICLSCAKECEIQKID